MRAQRILGILAAVVVATSLSVGAASTAQASPSNASVGVAAVEGGTVHPAEAAGKYVYNCVLTDGSSYTFTPGSNTTCNGSYIQQYIGGVMVQSVAITSSGQTAWASNECVLAVTAVTLVAVLTAGGVIGFVDALDIATQGNPPCTTSP